MIQDLCNVSRDTAELCLLRSVHDVCYTLTCRLSCFWAAKEYRGQDGKWHGEYKGTPETIRLRPFTLEEALIVQAFPDQFNIGRLRAVAREGIGNALPPPVMKSSPQTCC